MIVQCSACQTRFRLPDDKIKPEGTRVRCSRCKQVFSIQGSEAESPAAVAAIAPPAPAPAPAGDDFDSAFTEETGLAASPSSAAKKESAGQGDISFDFDDSLPGSGSEEPESFTFGEGPVPSPDSSAEADGFSFDEPAADAENDQPSSASFSFDESADAAAEFSFDEPTAGGFAFEEESDETPLAEKGTGSIAFEEDEFSLETSKPAWDGSADETPADEFSFTDQRPGKTGGDEFDFSNISFGEEPPPPLGGSATAPSSPGAHQSAPLQRPERSAPGYDERTAPPLAAPPITRRRRSPVSGVLTFVLLLLLILSAAAGYFIWQRGEIPDLSALAARLTGNPAPATPIGQIRITDLNSYFANNSEAGPLFVIQGKAVNEHSEARSAIAVKGILYGKSGQALLQQTVFTGNMLDDIALQSLPFARIEESMNNQFGDSLSNLNVAPGKAIPFTIVFKNLPADLAEFTVEIADSRPGSS